MLALAAPCATPAAPAADVSAGAASATAAAVPASAVPASAWVAHHVLPQLAAAWAVAAARRGGASGVALRMVAVAQPLLAAACAVLPAQAQVRGPSRLLRARPTPEPGPVAAMCAPEPGSRSV